MPGTTSNFRPGNALPPAKATAKPAGKAPAAEAKKPNCGSGNGGFKPGNTCGGAKRAALAADLRAARAAASSDADRKTISRSAKAHRDYLRGKDDSLGREAAKEIRDKLRQPRQEGIRLAKLGRGDSAALSKPTRPVDPASHGNHEPGHVGYLKTGLIHHDPHRFQYKLGHTETGSVGSLAGVQNYNHDLGGVLSVWKDPANGKVFVVNGHNRLDLAKRLGADKVTVRFLDAKTAGEARATGALQNIAEGRGTAIDAAKFFRDTGLSAKEIAAKDIPLREKVNTDGQALAHLDEKGFRRVIDGSLSPERGVIIGGSGLSHAQQRSLLELVDRRGKKRGDDLTNGQLRELVDDVKASPTARKETHDLFGSSVEEENLAVNRARVSSFVKEKLSKEKRLFGLVSRGKNSADLQRGGNTIDAARSGQIAEHAAAALHVFDQHKRLVGPVSRELNQAAERIHAGETPKKVYDDAYRRIFAAVRETLG